MLYKKINRGEEMRIFLILLGGITIVYGIYITRLRMKNPRKLMKYLMMKRIFGNLTGFVIHFIFYTVIPLTFGFCLMVINIFLLFLEK
jgi:hypothetical protein